MALFFYQPFATCPTLIFSRGMTASRKFSHLLLFSQISHTLLSRGQQRDKFSHSRRMLPTDGRRGRIYCDRKKAPTATESESPERRQQILDIFVRVPFWLGFYHHHHHHRFSEKGFCEKGVPPPPPPLAQNKFLLPLVGESWLRPA